MHCWTIEHYVYAYVARLVGGRWEGAFGWGGDFLKASGDRVELVCERTHQCNESLLQLISLVYSLVDKLSNEATSVSDRVSLLSNLLSITAERESREAHQDSRDSTAAHTHGAASWEVMATVVGEWWYYGGCSVR